MVYTKKIGVAAKAAKAKSKVPVPTKHIGGNTVAPSKLQTDKASMGSKASKASNADDSNQTSKKSITNRSGIPVNTVAIPTNNSHVRDDLTSIGGVTYRHLTKSTIDKESLRMSICAYVEREFFPNVKFIISNKKMVYYDQATHPNTYCAVIPKGCAVPEGYDVDNWWETIATQTVRRKVPQLRADRLIALKWEYYGKYSIDVYLFVFYFINIHLQPTLKQITLLLTSLTVGWNYVDTLMPIACSIPCLFLVLLEKDDSQDFYPR